MKYIFAWVGLAVLVAVGVGNGSWVSYRRLATHGVRGQGTILELLPKDHEIVRYEYEVGGRKFQGRMQSWKPNPPLERLSAGEQIVVYYNPGHPEESVLGEPTSILRNETIAIALAAFLVPTFMVVFWAWRSSIKKAHANDPAPVA